MVSKINKNINASYKIKVQFWDEKNYTFYFFVCDSTPEQIGSGEKL